MNKQHILGFFDDLVRTPVFLFLCAMFLCGAAAGGLTGLRAGEGDGAAVLSGLLAELPAHVVQSTLCALIWVLLPLNLLFSLWKRLLAKAFRLNGESKMSQEELLMLVDEVQQGGSIDKSEGELLRNAIEFSEQHPAGGLYRPGLRYDI